MKNTNIGIITINTSTKYDSIELPSSAPQPPNVSILDTA